MFNAYKNLLIKQEDFLFFAYKDQKMSKLAFNAKDIPGEYQYLFAAAPVLYANAESVAKHTDTVVNMLEPILAAVQTQQEKTLYSNLITLLSMLRRNSLTAMRVAEVGGRKVMADQIEDEKN